MAIDAVPDAPISARRRSVAGPYPIIGFLGALLIAVTAPRWRLDLETWRITLPFLPFNGTRPFTAIAFVVGRLAARDRVARSHLAGRAQHRVRTRPDADGPRDRVAVVHSGDARSAAAQQRHLQLRGRGRHDHERSRPDDRRDVQAAVRRVHLPRRSGVAGAVRRQPVRAGADGHRRGRGVRHRAHVGGDDLAAPVHRARCGAALGVGHRRHRSPSRRVATGRRRDRHRQPDRRAASRRRRSQRRHPHGAAVNRLRRRAARSFLAGRRLHRARDRGQASRGRRTRLSRVVSAGCRRRSQGSAEGHRQGVRRRPPAIIVAGVRGRRYRSVGLDPRGAQHGHDDRHVVVADAARVRAELASSARSDSRRTTSSGSAVLRLVGLAAGRVHLPATSRRRRAHRSGRGNGHLPARRHAARSGGVALVPRARVRAARCDATRPLAGIDPRAVRAVRGRGVPGRRASRSPCSRATTS